MRGRGEHRRGLRAVSRRDSVAMVPALRCARPWGALLASQRRDMITHFARCLGPGPAVGFSSRLCFASRTVRGRVSVLLELTELRKPIEALCLCCNAQLQSLMQAMQSCFPAAIWLSCSNSTSWPSRSSCRVSVATDAAPLQLKALGTCFNNGRSTKTHPGATLTLADTGTAALSCELNNKDTASTPGWPALRVRAGKQH